jgi:hypothetical protein
MEEDLTTPPFLLKDLDPEQRIRVLALDYVTSTGIVAPEQWLSAAAALEDFLINGAVEKPSAVLHTFPSSLS